MDILKFINFRKKLLLLSLVPFFSLSMISFCQESALQRADEVTREIRDVSNFDSIFVEGRLEVMVTVGKPYSLTLEGHKEDLDDIETIVEDNILRLKDTRNTSVIINGIVIGSYGRIYESCKSITCNNGKCTYYGCTPRKTSEPVKIMLTVPSLRSLDLVGSSDVIVYDAGNSPMEAKLTGSGDLRIHNIDRSDLVLTLIGSGDINVDGKVNNLDISVSGSGDVDSLSLDADAVEAAISGSGKIEVKAQETLDARVAGTGEIYYKGNARISQHVAGLGKIKQLR